MSDGKQSKPEDAKPGKIIDAEVEPVSPEEAAKPRTPGDPPRVDLRGPAGQDAAKAAAAAKPDAAATAKPAAGGPAAAGGAGMAGGTAAAGGQSSAGSGAGEAARSAARPATGRPASVGAAAGATAGSGSPAGTGGPPRGTGKGGSSGAGGSTSGSGSRGLAGVLLAVIVVLAVLVVGLVASPLVAPWLPQALGVSGPGDAAQRDGLQARLSSLETQMADTGKAAQAVQGQAGDLADLRRTIDDLQKRVQSMGGLAGQMDQLQKQIAALPRPDTGALDGEIAKLQSQLQSVQQDLAAASTPDPAVQQRLKQVDDDLTSVTRLADSIQRRMSGTDNRLNDLRSRDEAIEARLSGLDGRIAAASQPAPQVSAALTELRDRATALQARLDSLGSSLEAERTARLAAEDSSAGRNQRVALVLTLGQIEDRLDAGTSFAGEAAALPDLLTGSLAQDPLAREAVTVLRRQGQSAIAGFDRLRDDFMAAAGQAVRQRPAEAPAPGWWEQVVDGARGLVSIRPVGDVAGDSPGAILARAERALAARDLSRAAAEVGRLTGGPAEAMSGWLAQAQARLAVTGALARLNDAVTASLSPVAPEPGPADPDDTATEAATPAPAAAAQEPPAATPDSGAAAAGTAGKDGQAQ